MESLLQDLREAIADWRTPRPSTGLSGEDRGRAQGLEEAASHLEDILEEHEEEE